MQPLPLEFFLGFAILAVACERCGAPVPEDEMDCPECGEPLEEPWSPDAVEEDDG